MRFYGNFAASSIRGRQRSNTIAVALAFCVWRRRGDHRETRRNVYFHSLNHLKVVLLRYAEDVKNVIASAGCCGASERMRMIGGRGEQKTTQHKAHVIPVKVALFDILSEINTNLISSRPFNKSVNDYRPSSMAGDQLRGKRMTCSHLRNLSKQ